MLTSSMAARRAAHHSNKEALNLRLLAALLQAAAPAECAARAGSRAAEVFMGIDVFGRNTFGGGGFRSGRALRVAAAAGLIYSGACPR